MISMCQVLFHTKIKKLKKYVPIPQRFYSLSVNDITQAKQMWRAGFRTYRNIIKVGREKNSSKEILKSIRGMQVNRS